LLGAITAHEKDRKAAGGLGAALTERERDRRMAVSQSRVRRRKRVTSN
jgi:CCR4-NOT transcriptional complex subunit CAF120